MSSWLGYEYKNGHRRLVVVILFSSLVELAAAILMLQEGSFQLAPYAVACGGASIAICLALICIRGVREFEATIGFVLTLWWSAGVGLMTLKDSATAGAG